MLRTFHPTYDFSRETNFSNTPLWFDTQECTKQIKLVRNAQINDKKNTVSCLIRVFSLFFHRCTSVINRLRTTKGKLTTKKKWRRENHTDKTKVFNFSPCHNWWYEFTNSSPPPKHNIDVINVIDSAQYIVINIAHHSFIIGKPFQKITHNENGETG